MARSGQDLRPHERRSGDDEPSGDLAYVDSAAVIPPRRQSGPVAPELADYFRDQLAGHYIADRHLGSLRIDNLPLPVDMELMKTVKQLYESVPWDPI